MKFKDLIKDSEFECELITTDYETLYSFVWDEKMVKLTKKGEKHYKKILESEVKHLPNGNLLLLDETITYEELLDFLASCAGYTRQSRYDLLFEVRQ